MSPLLRLGPTFAIVVAALIAAEPTRAQSTLQTSLRFSLDWKLEGPAAIFLVPQERGYFRQEGLDVILVVQVGGHRIENVVRLAGVGKTTGQLGLLSCRERSRQEPRGPTSPGSVIPTRPTNGSTTSW